MNENAKQWVDALRSGEYRQTQGLLRWTDSYCCLGVACDLYAKAVPLEQGWDDRVFRTGSGSSETDLPLNVQSWLGLSTPDGEFDAGTLQDMNDGGASFGDIADIIASEPDGLFR